MDLARYLRKKEMEREKLREGRKICSACWQPNFGCFCHKIVKFDPRMEFVILIHPIESRRRIATGRMAYLSLEHAHMARGLHFEKCATVQSLMDDEEFQSVLLSPGPGSTDISTLSPEELDLEFGAGKRLRVFVVDGTWSNAGKMIHKSPNLRSLPRISFTPVKPSNIRVRKQPNPRYLCTLEAIHHTIELLGPSQGFDVGGGQHNNLLLPFNWMVENQLRRLAALGTNLAYRPRPGVPTTFCSGNESSERS